MSFPHFEGVKTCSKCGVPKDELEFYLRSPRGTRWTYCTECAKSAMKKNYHRNPQLHRQAGVKWREKNPEQNRLINWASHLKRLYGMTLDQYNQMVLAHDGKCAICTEKMQKPHIDHCHSTGKIRGLLCGPCNHAIGSLKDSPLRCFLAASYLQKHST